MKKVALVTGASRGIGAAVAKKLISQGYLVVGVFENNEEKAKQVEKFSEDIEMYKADVSSEEQIIRLTKYISEKYKRLDVLINNAGISIGGNIENFKLDDWNRLLAVNLTGKYLLCKYTLPLLKKYKGVIVNMSSRGGLNEFVFSGFIGYSVTNAGINNLTLGLAKELKDEEVRVNAVIPTVTDTDRFKDSFTPEEQEEVRRVGKLGSAEEVADLIYSLVSDNTKNGEIVVDKRVYIKTNA